MNGYPNSHSLDLAAITARLQAITPGPWHAWDRGIGWEIHQGRECAETGCIEINNQFRETFGESDAQFIAHAPADVAALLTEVAELHDALERCGKRAGRHLARAKSAEAEVERLREELRKTSNDD